LDYRNYNSCGWRRKFELKFMKRETILENLSAEGYTILDEVYSQKEVLQIHKGVCLTNLNIEHYLKQMTQRNDPPLGLKI
jgi:hypothetical protein